MTNQFTNNKKISALLYMLVGLFSLLIFLKNAWVTEDAFIILRSVDQFLLGHGFRWNPHERVQVYTSPLWYLLIIASTFFCKTLYLNLISLSLLLHIALLVAMAVFIKNIWRWLAAALLLTLSQGFF
jgi:arabinofuranosyltransferase